MMGASDAGTFFPSKRLNHHIITSNLVKYAHSGYPVHISAEERECGAEIRFVNMIRETPPGQDGTRIGVNNMKTMMKKMGGSCEIEQTRLMFRVSLWFPACGRADKSSNEKKERQSI